MRIVEAQVRMLEEELEKNTERLRKCQENKQKEDHEFGKNNDLGREINTLKTEINKIESLLNRTVVITSPKTDSIAIGSNANLLLNFGDGEQESCDVVLVENFVSREAQSGKFVSIKSELGKAIYGKKEGETFSYSLANTNISVSGQVLTIEKTTHLEKSPIVKRK